MKSFPLTLACLVIACVAVPALASNAMQDAQDTMAGNDLNVTMAAQNGSNQDGTATVKDVTGGVMVTVTIKNEPSGASEPAHIHAGTCAKLNPAPYKALSNVVDGTSTTTVKGVTIADLKKSSYAINVHESATNLSRYVSCGDL